MAFFEDVIEECRFSSAQITFRLVNSDQKWDGMKKSNNADSIKQTWVDRIRTGHNGYGYFDETEIP